MALRVLLGAGQVQQLQLENSRLAVRHRAAEDEMRALESSNKRAQQRAAALEKMLAAARHAFPTCSTSTVPLCDTRGLLCMSTSGPCFQVVIVLYVGLRSKRHKLVLRI